jgi:exonuclease VII small subunit
MRFGIGEKSDHTLQKVGQDFEVTRERIRHVQSPDAYGAAQRSSFRRVEDPMAYRTRRQHLEHRLCALQAERLELEASLAELERATERRECVEDELAQVEAAMAQYEDRRHLRTLRLATPCHARWDDMVGNGRVRFCLGCSKNVYDFSALSTEECLKLVYQHEGKVCAHFHRRRDGTVLTSDCREGARRRRKVVGLMIVAATSAAACSVATVPWESTLGGVELDDDIPEESPVGWFEPMPIELAVPKLDMTTGRIHETADIGAPTVEHGPPTSDAPAPTLAGKRQSID